MVLTAVRPGPTLGLIPSNCMQKKKSGMYSKIESREDAIKVIKDSAGGFFVVAAIQGVLGAFMMPGMLFDAAILAILAVILRLLQSRVAAVLVLVLSLAISVSTILTNLGIAKSGGSNILLAFIVLWAAIRAVQATFLLHGRFADSNQLPP